MTFPNPDDVSTSSVPVGGEDFDGEPEPEKQETGKGLRAKLTEALAKVKELEASKESEVGALSANLMDMAFQDLGLDPEHGIGRAAAQTYDGPAGGLAAYVEEQYGHLGPSNPLTPVILSEHARLDQVSQTAGSVPVSEDYADALAKAESTRDNETTLQLKGREVASWFNHR